MNIEDIATQSSIQLTKSIVENLLEKTYNDQREINTEIIQLKRQFKTNPTKSEMGRFYREIKKTGTPHPNDSLLTRFFKVKETRSCSGVLPISVITAPYPTYTNINGDKVTQQFSCKHDCAYCPRELDENGREKNARSYLSDEPTVARGLDNNYDAYKQFTSRAMQYYRNNHTVDKIELIVLGGTWTEYPRQYQEQYIRDLFYAANTFNDDNRLPLSLSQEHLINEEARVRIIGLTLEMRPDSINEEECKWLRYLGCTRVQLGIQHTDDKILKRVNRGCYLKHSIRALQLLKDHCFKVDAHWMPDLPGSSYEKDMKMFNYVINSQDLQFDDWKIYPTTVVPWTKLKKWHEDGSYKSWVEENPDSLIELLINVKQQVPEWIRINRVVRDIPNTTKAGDLYIYGGNKITNLRQLVHQKMEKENRGRCKCIRCREIKNKSKKSESMRIVCRKYNSSFGNEYFISMESGETQSSYFENNTWYTNKQKDNIENGILYGFARLRLSKNAGCSGKYFPELKNAAFIRELHVHGEVVTQNKTNTLHNSDSVQHQGIGKKLLEYAENQALMCGYEKIAVISGIGVRKYYARQGYLLENTYMIKNLNKSFSLLTITLFILVVHLLIAIWQS